MSDEEEQSLGNFFAKKDKGKKPKKKKKIKTSETTEVHPEIQQGKSQVDDWEDFEEKKEKDYSNLKIQDLQLLEENVKEDTDEDNDGDCEDHEKKNGDQTIWNATTASQPSDQVPQQVSTPNVVGGKYVPPSLKRSNMMGQQVKQRPGVPPDIKSQSAFPTLGAANEDLGTGKTQSDFEMVKRGIRSNDVRVDDKGPNLDLGNRYDGLRS